ncbi:MAG TPA: M20 family peptidase [Thermoanaerobaculia bacterium]|nr:M20 family peptidase [Thermoanaerobaculia bacterium]
MRRARRLALVVGCALAALLAVMVVAALRLPAPAPPAPPLSPAPIPATADVVARLAQALRFRTVSYDDPRRGDPAQLTALQGFLERSFPRVHAALRHEVVGGHSLLFTWPGRHPERPAVLLMAHQDVVPVEDERAWTEPPFGGVVAGGYLWGRGALDDKQAVLGILEACETLLGEGFTPERTVYLELGHDEEAGGRGARQVAELLAARRVHLAFVLDEGGFYTEGLFPGLRVPAALIGIAEKGYLSLELEARGEAGHSSRPPARMAIGALARALDRLQTHPFPPRVDGATRALLQALAPHLPFGQRLAMANLWLLEPLVARGLAADPDSAPLVRTTTALTVVRGGDKDNVLPGRARAVVNFRLLPGETPAGTLARARRIVGDPQVRMRPLAAAAAAGESPQPRAIAPPPVSRVGSPGWRVVARATEEAWGGGELVVAPWLLTGATDGRWFVPLADDVYRFTGFTIRQADKARFHGVDERIAVADYRRAIAVYYFVLRGLDRLGG